MTTTTAPAIRVRGIEKSYGELSVLRGVDVDVPPGSVVALLGSNGAGKTTLVRILATLLRADAGTATVAGADVALAGAARVLADNGGHPGHVFNLGHGVDPASDPGVLHAVVDLVHERTAAEP